MEPAHDDQPELFLPNGKLRADIFSPGARTAMEQCIRMTRETGWDTVRSPHVFMGLLASPDSLVQRWGARINADLPQLLSQFRELFQQDPPEKGILDLNREFLSDNVLRVLRHAGSRAMAGNRAIISTMDILICVLAGNNSIVAECFDRIGLAARKLAELARVTEQTAPDGESDGTTIT